MQRVIDRLNLLKVELRDLVIEQSLRRKILLEMQNECKDKLEIRLLNEDLKDNTAIIEDTKLDIEEIDLVVDTLILANGIKDWHKKRPTLAGNKVN